MAKELIEVFQIEDETFNDDLMTFQDDNDFEPVIELKPKKLRMKYKFYVAS